MSKNFVLDWGMGYYNFFNTIKEVNVFRKKMNCTGILYTRNGYLVDEENERDY